MDDAISDRTKSQIIALRLQGFSRDEIAKKLGKPGECVAGVLDEFADCDHSASTEMEEEEPDENGSLEWLSKDREENSAADEVPIGEDGFLESSVDEEAIRAIAEAFPSVTQEQIREVARLKTTTRLGYRRIGQKLNPPVGKDTIMRIWQMYKKLSKPLKPLAEDEEVKKFRAQIAQKERLLRLREEKEILVKQDLLLSLEIGGDDLVLRLVEHEMPKFDPYGPETYKEFMQYCERKQVTPKVALRIMGVTASNLACNFDLWYEVYYKDGRRGMKILTVEIWSEINAALPTTDTEYPQEN